MSRDEAIAMYATIVRTKLDRPLDEHEVELMRELYDDDIDADECAAMLQQDNAVLRFTTR